MITQPHPDARWDDHKRAWVMPEPATAAEAFELVADMAQQAAEEIELLRQEIDRLRPAAEAYAAICAILGLLPQPSQSFAPDLAHRLRKQAQELRAQPVGNIEE